MYHLYIATYIHTANMVFSTWICLHKLLSLVRCQLAQCRNLCVYRDAFQDDKLYTYWSVYQPIPLLDCKFLEVKGMAVFAALSPEPHRKYLFKQ